MSKYIMLVVGALILAGGIFLRDKKVGNVVQERILALATYAGWVLFTIPLSKLATPYFANAGGNWPKTGLLVLQTILFILGAELFLKRAFDPRAGEKYKKRKDYSKKKIKTGNNSKGNSRSDAAEAPKKEEEQPKKKGGFKKLN